MKGALLKGKTVKKVHQSFWTAADGCHTPKWVINRIEFTDGTFLTFGVVEGEADYGVEAQYHPAEGTK